MRGFSRLVTLFRFVALCLALSLSGVVHLALDVWRGDDAAAEHFCGDEDEEEGCPPGCAGCHCVHVSPVLPVPFAALGESRLLPAFEVAWAPYEGTRPPALAPPVVYRPPRA